MQRTLLHIEQQIRGLGEVTFLQMKLKNWERRGQQWVAGEEQVLPERVGDPRPAIPAMSSPIARSRMIAAHSITKLWLTDVKPAGLASRRQNLPRRRSPRSAAASGTWSA